MWDETVYEQVPPLFVPILCGLDFNSNEEFVHALIHTVRPYEYREAILYSVVCAVPSHERRILTFWNLW